MKQYQSNIILESLIFLVLAHIAKIELNIDGEISVYIKSYMSVIVAFMLGDLFEMYKLNHEHKQQDKTKT
jgi:hypothetical protein